MNDETTTETTETALERAVREAVAAAPPLSDDTRDQIARLLSRSSNADA